MTANLNLADILFMLDNVTIGATPAPGADPLAPSGIRAIDGTFNNITGLSVFDQYGNFVDTATFGNLNESFFKYSSSTSPLAYNNVVGNTFDTSARLVSNLIADATASNPSTSTAPMLTQGDLAVDRLPENSLFTFFGQFFDHGLDFVAKGGAGTVLIELDPSDPLYNPAFPYMPVSRAPQDANGETLNTTAPYIEQSQTYGSASTTTFYLMEYDTNGLPTGDLVHGQDGMGTWADIKANALKWAVAQAIAEGGPIPTEMLTDAHVLDVPDPAMWDVATASFLPGAGTGQAFIADIAHNANPDGGLTADADSVINPNGFGAPPPAAGEYDNELLDAHYVSGDPRVNENSALTAIHTAFHGEHTRLLEQIKDWVQQQNQIDPTFAAQWTGEMYFQAAKIANEMQYQHLVFEEFGRRMSPNIDAFAAYQIDINPNIMAEFAHAVYRLGHSQLTDNVKTIDIGGSEVNYTLIESFLNPVQFQDVGSGDFLKGAQFEQGGRIDEFVVDALRNFLVGLPLDLAAINIARGREIGLPSLNQLRADVFAQTGDTFLKPYESWAEFGANLLNPDSLVNFIAAYSNEASIAAARTTGDMAAMRAAAAAMMSDPVFMGTVANGGDDGFELIDLWMGGLAEKKVPLGLLGSTFDFIFAQQMIALQNGDRFYYLARIGGNLLDEIEGQTLADLMMRSGDAVHMHGDAFGTPDVLIEMGALAMTHFLKSPAEMVEYLSEVIGGTNDANMIYGGAGNDAIHGEGGNDVIFGGENDDHLYGGDGDDVMWGDQGFDKMRGDAGNDEMHGGADDDFMFGGLGNDLMFGDSGFEEMSGGAGNDTMFGGTQDDALLGGEGNDELHGDDGDDGLDGEAGHDVIYGGRGDDLMTGGEGDDILIGGAGADAMDGGVGGWDIASYANWLESLAPGAGIGLIINMLNSALSTGDARDDSYIDIESLIGTKFNDTITGDDFGHTLIGGLGNDTITGGLLDDVLIGMEGNDRLIGGGGVDTALFRGLEADFTITAALGGFSVQDTETAVSSNEGTDFVGNSVEWLQFDDALLNLTTAQYAPLVNLSNTQERVQGGQTILGELQSNVVLNDGAAVPGVGIVIGNIEIADPDGANGGPVTLAVLGPDAASFAIAPGAGGVNQLLFIGGGAGSFVNYEVKPYYNVTISALDAIGGSTVNVTVNVADANDNAPVITSGQRINVTEGISTDAIVYWARSTDWDTTGEAITYTLGGDDAGAFTFVNGELRFASSPTAIAPADVGSDGVYNVTVTASDGVHTSAAQNVAIHVAATTAINTIIGDALANNLVGTVDPDLIQGLAGNDTLLGGDSGDRLEGGDGGDALLGQNGNDLLFGGNSTDTLNGGAGADTMDGGENSDEYVVDGLDIVTDTGTSGTDKVVIGNAAGDSISTAGWSGIEIINGNAGNDTIDASTSTENLLIRGQGGNDVITGGSGNDVLLGGAGNDTINGGAGNDTILGGLDDDLLTGGDGNDVFFIGESLDAVTDGGAGFDKAVINNASGISINIGSWIGVERINGYTGADTIDATGMATSITMSGGDGADSLIGGNAADAFYAGQGDDTVFGGLGNDALIGNAGADDLNGGAGDDFLLGGADADTFRFTDGFGNDVVADFEDGLDVLNFAGDTRVTLASDLNMVDEIGGVSITVGGDTLFVQGMTVATLTDDIVLT